MYRILSLCVFFGVSISLFGGGRIDTHNRKSIFIREEFDPNFTIREGLVSQVKEIIKIRRDNKVIAKVRLTKPVMVAQAEKDEPWGFFQFPSIGRTDDGILLVSWQMADDSHKTYGIKPNAKFMMSKDGGLTWMLQNKEYYKITNDNHVHMKDGSFLEIAIPSSRDIKIYHQFPLPVERKGNYYFYRMDSLPEELQGVFLTQKVSQNLLKTIHAKLNDPGLLRYAIDNLMPMVWWGNMKQLADGVLIAGVNPSFYQDKSGHVLPNGVSFYRSEDNGLTWYICSRIPYIHDGIAEIRGGNSFEEPAFEILKDSTFLCVMRTGSASPLYCCYSEDYGKSWSTPTPFTPNGVKPRLLLLKNGVLVLVSGRPGIQIRFCFDEKGKTWSDPIDMLPFMKEDGSYNSNVSCGYASILEADDDSFYVVYSDFTAKNTRNNIRKTIWCRKITINT